MINNCVVTDYITPEEYLDMRQSVEWSVFPIEQATEGIKNTTHICFMAVKGKEEFYKSLDLWSARTKTSDAECISGLKGKK